MNTSDREPLSSARSPQGAPGRWCRAIPPVRAPAVCPISLGLGDGVRVLNDAQAQQRTHRGGSPSQLSTAPPDTVPLPATRRHSPPRPPAHSSKTEDQHLRMRAAARQLATESCDHIAAVRGLLQRSAPWAGRTDRNVDLPTDFASIRGAGGLLMSVHDC